MTFGNADLIGDALRSVVEHVDRCLVVDTMGNADVLAAAREAASDKLVVRPWAWTSCSAGRNESLRLAAEIGGSWAITLDTDERLHGAGRLRESLATTHADVLLVQIGRAHV